MSLRLDKVSPFRYCALAYSKSETASLVNYDEPVIVLLVQPEGGELLLFLDPSWRAHVNPGDCQYFSELWADFVRRSQDQPDDLFRQLCSISIGPLVTAAVGNDQDYAEQLGEKCEQFIPLDQKLE
jgi:hypothetical protein